MNYITMDSLAAVANCKDYTWWKDAQAKVTADYDRLWNKRANDGTEPVIPVESFKAWYELADIDHVLWQLHTYSSISLEMYCTCNWLDLRRQQKVCSFSHTFKGHTVTYNKFTNEFLFMSANGTDIVNANDLDTYLGGTWTQYEQVKVSREAVHPWVQHALLDLPKCFDVYRFKDLVDMIVDHLESNQVIEDDEECYEDDED